MSYVFLLADRLTVITVARLASRKSSPSLMAAPKRGQKETAMIFLWGKKGDHWDVNLSADIEQSGEHSVF